MAKVEITDGRIGFLKTEGNFYLMESPTVTGGYNWQTHGVADIAVSSSRVGFVTAAGDAYARDAGQWYWQANGVSDLTFN